MPIRRFLLAALFPVMFVGPLLARQAGNQIRVNISEAAGSRSGTPPLTYLNGYRRTLSGQLIQYRSSHPDAEIALLARARKDVRSIAWETDSVPRRYAGEFYRFLWLAGLEREGFQNQGEVHSFTMLVNGERWFTFQNRKDSTARHWSVKAPNGSILSFDAAVVDRVGDLFGTMLLEIPRAVIPSGKPLKLEVIGEDAESADWFMTFQYTFSSEPRVRTEPVLRRGPLGATQLLRLSLDNLQPGRMIQISYGSRVVTSKPLEIGSNVFLIPLQAVKAERKIALSLTLNGVQVAMRTVTAKPVKRRDIYLLSYSHNDIGYTDLQPNIERKQWRNLDEALQIIAQTKDYPPEARFKWNMEVLWALDGYLRERPEEDRRAVIEAIRSGRIGLNGLYANVLTGLAGTEEMNHFTEFARSLKSKYQFEITSALVSDVPGFTWGIVPALAHSGVKYFSISPNPGDRIGSTIETLGDKPFYWVSQSGQERILTWVAAASYASFHEGDLTKLGDDKIFKLLRKLDESNYPYEIVQLPYTIGGDNGPPDPRLSDFVKRWNETYESPKLLIATHAEMFHEFELRYGASLPVYSGDFTPYWEDGAASSAYETMLNRQAADRLIQAGAVWAMRDPRSYPAADFSWAWRNVVLYDEHTWGAHNSVSEPDLPFVRGQWEIKRRFATDADSLSRSLLARALGHRGTTRIDSSFIVINTHSWPRTDLVMLPAEQSSAGDMVVDQLGNVVPSQRLSTGELAVLIKDLPAFSSKQYRIRKGKALDPGSVQIVGNTLENRTIRVSINPGSGALESMMLRKNGINLVDVGKGNGLNEYVYVPGKDPQDSQHLQKVKIRLGEKGGLISSLVVEAEAPGCSAYSYEVRLVEDLDRVDIINRIDKKAIRTKEAVHLAFPFDVPGGELRYDVAWGIVRPELEQIPGSCKNFFSVQSWVDVSNAERGVIWATPDAPLIEIGSINAEKPWMSEIGPAQNFYSYLMNNYWHTNYKADQEGPAAFRFAVRPHGRFDPASAVRFGVEQRQPLIVSFPDSAATAQTLSFDLGSSEVLSLSTKPLESSSALHVTLYNPTAKPQAVELKWRGKAMKVFLSDVDGGRGNQVPGKIGVGRYGSAYLVLEPQ
ncbi:MAG: hypothetical protein A2X66_04745 [Ignavibacteria bacterium GWA2_54_16]|nr:MAG: hypothetical protein A2X66_04745 [Ignavibacteria bacterium GWA2_54_16]